MLVMKHPINRTEIYFSIDFPGPQVVTVTFGDGTVKSRRLITPESHFAAQMREGLEAAVEIVEAHVGMKLFPRPLFPLPGTRR